MMELPPCPGGIRLDRYLAECLPEHSRSRLALLVEEGQVIVNSEPAIKASLRLREGDLVRVTEVPERVNRTIEPIEMDLTVPYEDESLLVVYKPRGLSVHPSPGSRGVTLVNGLVARSHELSQGSAPYRPGLVHRLDKDTTGILIVAKTDSVHAKMADAIRQRQVERRYVAVVKGTLRHKVFTVDAPLGRDPKRPLARAVIPDGKPARTHVRLVQRVESGALVIARLESGRTHQIRVHLASVGHPVLGDDLYAPPPAYHGPLQLHAGWLRFAHPLREETVSVYAPPPDDFVSRDFVSEEMGWQ
ncbi:MAG: RluA family pseudouridine synthase [Fimbriimonadaceae bacterium]|nr:RluA family pseudouridine synthase [Fimbriimonadaceae bacterium]